MEIAIFVLLVLILIGICGLGYQNHTNKRDRIVHLGESRQAAPRDKTKRYVKLGRPK